MMMQNGECYLNKNDEVANACFYYHSMTRLYLTYIMCICDYNILTLSKYLLSDELFMVNTAEDRYRPCNNRTGLPTTRLPCLL